jgi:hypothetical protein
MSNLQASSLKNIILTSLMCLMLVSCNLLLDLSPAKDLMQAKDYQGAIAFLEQYEGARAAKLNSEAHVRLAQEIVADTSVSAKDRYLSAKPILKQAIELDPSNSQARAYYRFILKTLKIKFNYVD